VTAVATARDVRDMGPLQDPRQAGGLHDVFRRRYLLWLLVRKEVKVRYQGSFLGLAWSYVQPIVRFCVYYFIANLIISHSTQNRALHIFSGMVMLQFFHTALSAGAKAIIKNKSLVRKINMPHEMFPVASIAVSLYNMFPMYVVLIIGDFIGHWHPDIAALWAALLGFAIAVVYGLGFAIILSAANVFIRDTTNIVEVVNTVLRWTAPVIYTYSTIRPKLLDHPWVDQLYICNPFNVAVMMNNRAFWITSFPVVPPTPAHDGHPAKPGISDPIAHGVAQEMPGHLFERGLIVLAAGFVFVMVAQLIFSRVDGRFADKL
jgi:ABC-type polysaccharide/polyol phosphate export permease